MAAFSISRLVELPVEQGADEAPSVNETGNISTQADADPIDQIRDGDIARKWATQREQRAAPICKLGAFRGYESFRSLMRSLRKVGQQDKGKKTRSGKTYIGNDREAACELLGIFFQYEQTDYDDDDPLVLEAATDSNAERRRETQGQAICTAVRTRVYHEEVQKQRPLHQLPTYERLAQKFVGSKRSHRSVRDARKVLDQCPELFACIERDYVTVASAKQLFDQVDKTKWPEIVRILNVDREAEADNCDGEQDVQSRQRWRGDERIAPFLQRLKTATSKKGQPTVRPIVQGQSILKDEDPSTAGCNGASTPATEQDEKSDDPDPGTADTGPSEVVGAAAPAVNDTPIADEPSRDGHPSESAPGQVPGAGDTTVDLGVFKDSLTALIQLQGLLRTHRATDALIEALESTLKTAQESAR